MKAQYWLVIFFSISLISAATVQFSLVYLNIPLRFSNAISYDAKLTFIKKSNLLEKADTLVIGSSMSFNNINGIMLENNSSKIYKVANIASWGLEMSQTLELVTRVNLKNIKYIVLSIEYGDFTKKYPRGIDYEVVEDFLNDKFTIKPYLKRFTSALLDFDMYFNFDKIYHNPNSYKSLVFDKTGSVNLNFPKKYISQNRWGMVKEFKHTLQNSSFQALVKLARLCTDNKIELIVATSPIRISILKNNLKLKKELNFFTQKIKNISEVEDFKYIDIHGSEIFTDKYFLDIEHLNLTGTRLYTSLIINKAGLN